MELVFASGNKNKINQMKLLLDKVDLKSPKDFNIDKFEVVEDGDTLSENAYKKAKALFDELQIPIIADDTGLFVDTLNGRPGVHSHRYASDNPTYKENREKLLLDLKGNTDRKAHFKTVICFIDQTGKDHYFEGKLNGEITNEEIGDYEFGYDQIFRPKNLEKTLGQMSDYEINEISHRSIAINNFKQFLEDNYD